MVAETKMVWRSLLTFLRILLDVVAEADVEHAVDFVEDDLTHVVEVQVAVLVEIHQAAGGRDDDLGVALRVLHLLGNRLAAVDGDALDGC